MRSSRHTTAFGSVVLALLLACSACSSSPDVSTVRQQFQTIVQNTDKALTRDHSANHPNQSYAKYSVDFHQAAVQIAALAFPASMQHDAQALVTALNTLSTDAAKVARAAAKPQTVQANVLAMAKLNLTLMEQEKAELPISNALRLALGLPEETTTTTTAPATPTPLTPTPTPLTPTPTPLTPTPTVPATTAG